MIDKRYGYDPRMGCEQFYNCELPDDKTAPITLWLRDHANHHFLDVKMPEGHVIRAIYGETLKYYVGRGGIVLPDEALETSDDDLLVELVS
jgi:hypothetical protein